MNSEDVKLSHKAALRPSGPPREAKQLQPIKTAMKAHHFDKWKKSPQHQNREIISFYHSRVVSLGSRDALLGAVIPSILTGLL